MDELGKIHQLIIPFFGHDMTFNLEVIAMTWIVIVLLLIFGFLATHNRAIVPKPIQVVGELFVSLLYDLTEDSLGEELAKKYAPLIFALFLFLIGLQLVGDYSPSGRAHKGFKYPLKFGNNGVFCRPLCWHKGKGIQGIYQHVF